MARSWLLLSLSALAWCCLTVRAQCDAVERYLDIPVPLTEDTEIDLNVMTIDCPANGELPDELDEIIVDGGTLTLRGLRAYVRFVNLRFTVEDGATLIFDMDSTLFGPNSGYSENAQGFMVDVKEGGAVYFKGTFAGREVDNVRSMFNNAGTIEFESDAVFEQNGNVFRSNEGTIKFRGDTSFSDNFYLAIDNINSGYIRFSKTALFQRNARSFDGGNGCAVENQDTTGTVIFRGDATFNEHSCEGAGAIDNAGTMTFYGKAKFKDNTSSRSDGGAVRNRIGTMTFKAAAQFVGNTADLGGGLAVEGGAVQFNKAVLFDTNEARQTGGAFSLTSGSKFENGETITGAGSLTFKRPSVVRKSGNTALNEEPDEAIPACNVGYVEEGSSLEGFPDEDVCEEA